MPSPSALQCRTGSRWHLLSANYCGTSLKRGICGWGHESFSCKPAVISEQKARIKLCCFLPCTRFWKLCHCMPWKGQVLYRAFACILLSWKRQPFWRTASIDFHCAPKWPLWRLPSCCNAVTSYANALLCKHN